MLLTEPLRWCPVCGVGLVGCRDLPPLGHADRLINEFHIRDQVDALGVELACDCLAEALGEPAG